MRYHFPKTIAQLALLLVGNPSSGESHVTSLEQRKPRPAVRGGGGLRRNLEGSTASNNFDRLLVDDGDDAVYDETTADDSSANGNVVAFSSRVQNWESVVVSKFNDWESAANSTAWEFYESPPSQWTQHQWDLVIDLLLGIGSMIILCCICCVNLFTERIVEKAPSPVEKAPPPSPLSPKVTTRDQTRSRPRSYLWGPWSPTGSSFFFSGSESTSWSSKRRSRRHRRNGGRDGGRGRRRRLIDSEDETEKRRGSESDDDEYTDDDSSVESRADQSTSYEPPECKCTMSEESNNSTLFSSFESQSPRKLPTEVKIDAKHLDVVDPAIDSEEKGAQREKTGAEITARPFILVGNQTNSIEVGTQASTKNPGVNVFLYNTKEEDVQDEKASSTTAPPETEMSPRNRILSHSRSMEWKKKLHDMKKRMDQRKSALSPDVPDWKDRKPPLARSEGSRTKTEEQSVLSKGSAHVDGRSKDTDEIGEKVTGTKARELEDLIRDVLEKPVAEGDVVTKKRKKKKNATVVV
jgi:hypothetical protein